MRGVEQAQIQKTEARACKEREQVARTFGFHTEASLDLLVELGYPDAKLAFVVGRALGRRARSTQAAKARKLGAELGYPAVGALDLGEGKTTGEPILPTRNTLGATVCRICQAG
ncbi:MAG: hypothetical protein ACJ8CB_15000 [Ktedonobacteraceae bacterium]